MEIGFFELIRYVTKYKYTYTQFLIGNLIRNTKMPAGDEKLNTSIFLYWKFYLSPKNRKLRKIEIFIVPLGKVLERKQYQICTPSSSFYFQTLKERKMLRHNNTCAVTNHKKGRSRLLKLSVTLD